MALRTWGKCSLASDVQRTTLLRTRIKGFALPSVRLSFSINAVSRRCCYGTDIGWKWDAHIILGGYFWSKKKSDILKNREVCFVWFFFHSCGREKWPEPGNFCGNHILDNKQLKLFLTQLHIIHMIRDSHSRLSAYWRKLWPFVCVYMCS